MTITVLMFVAEGGCQTMASDITEGKAAELALIENRRELVEAQRLANLGSWRWEATTGELYWSEEVYRILGYDPQQPMPGLQEHLALYTAESRARVEAALAARRDERPRELELELVTPAGIRKWIVACCEPVRDTGRIIGLRGTVQDITRRKYQEEFIRLTSREIADLYNHAPCGYHSLDTNGYFVSINETELSWLGYRWDEVVGKLRLLDLIAPESQAVFDETFPKLKQHGFSRDVELELVRKDGGMIPVMVSATAVMDSNGCFVRSRSTVYDMTERRQMEQERANYHRRLQKLAHHMVDMQELERRWLSGELHDRNSANLAAIAINLRELGQSLPNEWRAKFADLLADTQALLEDTMDSIREVCMNLRPILLDDVGLWPALEGYAQQFSRRTGIAVHLRKPEREMKFAPNIKSTLFRITQEALTNCAKHAQATVVAIVLAECEGDAVLTISDNGMGFDPDEYGKPGHAPHLGLVTMRERAEFAGGRFSYASSAGQGMHIKVEFPATSHCFP